MGDVRLLLLALKGNYVWNKNVLLGNWSVESKVEI